MILEAFRTLSGASTAPQLLVTSGGKILAANLAAVHLLDQPWEEVEGSDLRRWVDPSGTDVGELLKLLSASGSPLPGALNLVTAEGAAVRCYVEGARISSNPAEPGDPPLLVLRLALKESSGSRFAVLTQQVEELRREVRRRHHAELLLQRQKGVLELIVGNHPLSDVLNAIAHFIEDHSQRSLCSILLLSEDGQRLCFGAAPSLPAAYNSRIDDLEIGARAGSCGTAAFLGERVLVNDISRDPLWAEFRDLAAEHGLAACWSEPVKGPEGQVLGTLAMYNREAGPPSEEDLYLTSIGVDLTAIAILSDRSRATLRRRAAQLADADRRKDRFLAMLSHELRNPLGPIVNTLEILDQQAGREDLATHVARLKRQTTHLSRLVDDLLDISRIAHGAIELKIAKVDLRECLAQAVDSVSELIASRRQHLVLPGAGEPLWVDGDAGRLRQVFANLLTNASKYTPPEGKVEVELDRRDETIIARVRDDGQGLSPELREHLFEPFSQGGKSALDSREGLGLGLTLVKQLVECHGGLVEAASEGIGKGSEFTVRLPETSRSEEMLSQEKLLSTMEVPPLDVLIAEDNEDSAEALAVLLELWGHAPRMVHDGDRAVEEALKKEPDVLLLDIDLPGRDGYSVLRTLRQSGFSTTDRLAIAMTGFGRVRDIEESAAAGFHHHMTKPADPTKLRGLLVDFSEKKLGSRAGMTARE